MPECEKPHVQRGDGFFIREEELENEEIIAICRKNNITISDLMAKVNRQKAEMKKEKTNENQFEKE